MKILFILNNEAIVKVVMNKLSEYTSDILTNESEKYENETVSDTESILNLENLPVYSDIIIDERLFQTKSKLVSILIKIKEINKKATIQILTKDGAKFGSKFLKKVYDLEIYGALLGNDKRISTLVKNIIEPPSKEFARDYYKIIDEDIFNGNTKKEIITITPKEEIRKPKFITIPENDVISSEIVKNFLSSSEEKKIELKKIYLENKPKSKLNIGNRRIVSFVGASKNGVSFLINSLAIIFSSLGIDVAILDLTKNKNSYYISTDNNEKLQNDARNSIEKLKDGIAKGVQINRFLNVYTALPSIRIDDSDAKTILETLCKNHQLVLVDCDFTTPYQYFDYSNAIYLVQSMDILTIQPLTELLKELKKLNIYDENKLRIVINKEMLVRGLSRKKIVAGLSTYNSATMTSMIQLFNKDEVKVFSIPFDIEVAKLYLENMAFCKYDISKYPRRFISILKDIAADVLPLSSRNNSTVLEYSDSRKFNEKIDRNLNEMKKNFT